MSWCAVYMQPTQTVGGQVGAGEWTRPSGAPVVRGITTQGCRKGINPYHGMDIVRRRCDRSHRADSQDG